MGDGRGGYTPLGPSSELDDGAGGAASSSSDSSSPTLPSSSRRLMQVCFLFSFITSAAGVLTMALLRSPTTNTCETDKDCQYNGVCTDSSGDSGDGSIGGLSCHCYPGWTGTTCGALDLVSPASVVPAYPPPGDSALVTSWGGSILNDQSQSRYWMVASEMTNSCGMNTWTTNSRIISAVASVPEGPYTRSQVLMEPFAHNPVVSRAPDGTYIIFHIGCGTGGSGGLSSCTNCSNGVTIDCPTPGETVACDDKSTNILYSKTLDGPWSRMNVPIVKAGTGRPPDMGKYGVDNPAPFFFPNGSLLMLGRDDWNSVGIITADSWRGPYTLRGLIGPAPYTIEDAFLWRDSQHTNFFHALFHGGKQGGGFVNAGAHAFSEDGISWTFGTREPAYTTTVTTSDGQEHEYTRRERPHLLFNDSGYPTHLSTSLWTGPKDHAVTFVQAINLA
eukprot:UC1_evm4s531